MDTQRGNMTNMVVTDSYSTVLGLLLSFLQLFLWPLEGTSNVKVNGETLEDALARLNQDISSLPPLTNLIPGNVSGLLFFFLLRKNCGLLFV